ncbi:MAG: hypothetical protein M1826_001084 [Phylliscum demangeonii]|nr:MAG: hypothetical protein M1826_001084 [Phylliscum demangeonii]
MPAPLAKGLVLAATVLVAAGLAIYENPDVQEWLERTRRKIASALYNVGDDRYDQPQQHQYHHAATSAHDDEKVAWAVEAARRKRDEILASRYHRDRLISQQEQRTANLKRATETGYDAAGDDNHRRTSFSGFLKQDETGAYTLQNTSAEPVPPTEGMTARLRTAADRAEANQDPDAAQAVASSRSSITLRSNEAEDEDPEPLVRIHTAAAPDSRASSVMVATPLSTISTTTLGAVYALPAHEPSSSPEAVPDALGRSAYFSVDEWIDDRSSSPAMAAALVNYQSLVPLAATPLAAASDPLHAPSRSPPSLSPAPAASSPSIAGSIDDLMHDVQSRCSDVISVMSDFSGIPTPGTWTEVGSEVSEGDFGGL